jgi:hypothetical protein
LNADKVDYIGDPEKQIEIVASCAGAGGDFISSQKAGADLFITGEAKYHEMLPVLDGDMAMACYRAFYNGISCNGSTKTAFTKWLNDLQYNIEIIPSEDYGKCFRRLRNKHGLFLFIIIEGGCKYGTIGSTLWKYQELDLQMDQYILEKKNSDSRQKAVED